jgi:hypothetical protein
MNLWSRLFGKPAPDDSPKPGGPRARRWRDAPQPAQKTSESVPFKRYGSGFAVAVVGESHYQDHLRSFCQVRESSADLRFRAFLYNEDDNPYDDQAVRVEIQGGTVGHLSRKDARAYRQWLARERPGANVLTCEANVRGGWDRGPGDRGMFGVWLDLPI